MATIQIPFYPGVDKSDLDFGTMAEVGWHRPEVMHALKQMFRIRDNEKIVGVTVSEAGIKAKIEFIKP